MFPCVWIGKQNEHISNIWDMLEVFISVNCISLWGLEEEMVLFWCWKESFYIIRSFQKNILYSVLIGLFKTCFKFSAFINWSSDGSLGSIHRWRSQRIAISQSCELQDTIQSSGCGTPYLLNELVAYENNFFVFRACLIECTLDLLTNNFHVRWKNKTSVLNESCVYGNIQYTSHKQTKWKSIDLK